MLLPAKLSFLASKYQSIGEEKSDFFAANNETMSCVHGIRAYGERCLQSASESTEDIDKQEEHKTKGSAIITFFIIIIIIITCLIFKKNNN